VATRLILNADDFGRSSSINRAVIRAHREGVLTSASLMVTGEAAAEAVALARQTPSLAVGLHLVLSGERPALPPSAIPHLVGGDGRFPANPAAAGARYVLSRTARAELEREVKAQLELFAATGLALDHVNAHTHLHLLPGVFEIVAAAAASYGAAGIRVAGDDLGLSLRHDRRSAGAKLLWAAAFGVFGRRAVRRLDGDGRLTGADRLVRADRVFGLMQTGRMSEGYVLALLRTLALRGASGGDGASGGNGPKLVEVYFHPDTAPQVEAFGPNPGDLATLLSPAVRRAIADGPFELCTYGRVRRDEGR